MLGLQKISPFFIQLRKVLWRLSMVGVLLYAGSVEAATGATVPDIGTMLINLAKANDGLMRLITAISYILGFYFVLKGVAELKHVGESRTMMSREHHIKGPLFTIAAGTALIYLPASVHVGISTFWESQFPVPYVPTSSDPWADLIKACFMIIQIVGVVAFIRGLVLLTHVSEGHGQSGGFAKAIAHLVGGIFCINMYQFILIIENTLAPGVLPPPS